MDMDVLTLRLTWTMDMTDHMGDEHDGKAYIHCVAEELTAIMVLADSL